MLDPLFTQDGPYIDLVDQQMKAYLECQVTVNCWTHGEQWCVFDDGHLCNHGCIRCNHTWT